MKCNQCGFEAAENSLFCPRCGERMCQDQAPGNAFADRILPALQNPLFLVICILLSASCLMSLSAGSVPLIDILITVFLWLTYAQAKKDIADVNHLRCVSGAVYAQYVISYVVAILVLVMGVILSAALGAVGSTMPGLWDQVMGELAQEEAFVFLMSILPAVSGAVIVALAALVTVIVIVFNIFTMRYLHRFAKSVYRSIEQGTSVLEYIKAAKIVLFILGGVAAISGLSSLVDGQIYGLISNATSSSASIIAGLLVGKYLEPNE